MIVPRWLIILLGVLTAVGPISTDMYLPAFPAIEQSLHGQIGDAQVTLATWFAGLSIGQLTQGTLADRYGRRMPLIIGTAMYTLASIGCALAPNLFWLSTFRLLAAFGGSASMVIPRAIVRDLADGHAAARMLSRLMLVMGAAPILAPTMGGFVLQFGSWRLIFWIAAVYGALCCIAVAFALPDTLPKANRVKLGAAAQINRYVTISRDRGFISHVALGGFALFALFAYIGGSPPVFIEHFHLSPPTYGALFGVCAFGLIVASQLNPHLLGVFGSNRMLTWTTRIALAAGIAEAVVAFGRIDGWLALAVPIAVIVACQGFTGPNATVGALSRHSAHAGSASALMGTLQFLLGAISGVLAGVLSDGTPRAMAALMLFGTVAAVICDLCRPRPAVVEPKATRKESSRA